MKYILTDETIEVHYRILHRIKAIVDFDDVKAGDLGGFIEREENLSHEGMAWVYDNAKVFDYARVRGNGKVYDNAEIWDHADVCMDASVRNNAKVHDNARIWQGAEIYGDAMVGGHSLVEGDAKVYGNAIVNLALDFEISGNARVFENAEVLGAVRVDDDAQVFGDAIVAGNARVGKNAVISKTSDCIVIGPFGFHANFLTFYKTKDDIFAHWMYCYGTIDEVICEIEKSIENGEEMNDTGYKLAADFVKHKLGTRQYNKDNIGMVVDT